MENNFWDFQIREIKREELYEENLEEVDIFFRKFCKKKGYLARLMEKEKKKDE